MANCGKKYGLADVSIIEKAIEEGWLIVKRAKNPTPKGNLQARDEAVFAIAKNRKSM